MAEPERRDAFAPPAETDHSPYELRLPPRSPRPDEGDGGTPYRTPSPQRSPKSPRRPLDEDAQKLRDKLSQAIESRPARDNLVEHNILKADEKLAPALHATTDALRKAGDARPSPEKIALGLEHALQSRPGRGELIGQNILKDGKVAPSLQAASQNVRKERLAQHLEHMIEARPERDAVLQRTAIHKNAQPECSRGQMMTMLEQKIDARPAKDELIRQHILPIGSPTPAQRAAAAAAAAEAGAAASPLIVPVDMPDAEDTAMEESDEDYEDEMAVAQASGAGDAQEQ
eukprot:m51a1_g3399 hypothetical protein (287) ;mRNA; f:540630-541714